MFTLMPSLSCQYTMAAPTRGAVCLSTHPLGVFFVKKGPDSACMGKQMPWLCKTRGEMCFPGYWKGMRCFCGVQVAL